MQNKKNKERVININALSPTKISAIILSTAIVIISGITIFTYLREVANEKDTFMTNEQIRLDIMKEYVEQNLESAESDLHIASTHEELQTLKDLEGLEGEYLEMSKAKKTYDQIRYLDEDGMEIVRVDYNEGIPATVKDEDLQNKKDRYYFEDTANLNEGQVFVSPLDLNIEHGEIEQPLKPMIRFGRPIFDTEGNHNGVVIINYLAKNLLDGMEEAYTSEEGELLMFNQDGYWLKAINEEDEWGFMYDGKEDKIVENVYPKVWDSIRKNKTGQLETEEGLFTYVTVYPLSLSHISSTGVQEAYEASEYKIEGNEYFWVVASFIPASHLASTATSFLYRILVVDALFLLIIFFITWRLHIAIKERRRAENTVFKLNDILRIINKILRHDISGKLSNIRASLEVSDLIKKDENVKGAYDNTLGGIDLVNQMRDLEQSVKTDSELKKFELKKIIEEVGREQEMNIDINCETDSNDCEVMADEAIKSVFENLVRNAKIHGGVDRIDVDIKENRNEVMISVKDNGRGVPEDARDNIFEEGFTSGEAGNTGLGLYITKKTIERYDGSIHFEPNNPKGSIFVIELPKG